jgi:hypothetical protein
MLSYRAHVWICVGLLIALFGIPIVGNIVQAAGTATLPRAVQLPLMIFYFGLFVAFGLSAIPVMVMTVARRQNLDLLKRSETAIIWIMWGLILAGLAVALPAMIADGFFAGAQSSIARPGTGG